MKSSQGGSPCSQLLHRRTYLLCNLQRKRSKGLLGANLQSQMAATRKQATLGEASLEAESRRVKTLGAVFLRELRVLRGQAFLLGRPRLLRYDSPRWPQQAPALNNGNLLDIVFRDE